MPKPEQIYESDTLIFCFCGKKTACTFTKRIILDGDGISFIPGGYNEKICLKQQNLLYEKNVQNKENKTK